MSVASHGSGLLPPSNRSRTPPRPDFEPIAESRLVRTIVELLQTPAITSTRPSTQSRRHDKKHTKTPAPRNSHHTHSHSHSHSHSASYQIPPPASPIDTLASVAAFHGSPTFNNSFNPQYSPLLNGFYPQNDERSTKRARSEVLPSPHFQTSPRFDTAARPSTSYNHNGWGYNVEDGISHSQRIGAWANPATAPEPHVSEAELLLNFSRGGSMSSSHGLGIRAPVAELQPVHHTPPLPPFPYTTSGQGAIDIATLRQENDAAASSGQAVQTPISPSHEKQASVRESTSLQTYTPPEDVNVSEPSRTSISTEVGRVALARHEGLELHERSDHYEDNAQEQLKSPDSTGDDTNGDSWRHSNLSSTSTTWASHADGRRFSDSHHINKSGRLQLGSGARSSSVPPEHQVGRSMDANTMNGAQMITDSPLRLHQQGVVCPACRFAADVMSDKVDWMQCDGCDQWYHAACAGFSAKQSERIDKYYCKSCVPRLGKSTWKRKSTRVRQTVDYAGLNEGVLRMPDENREHHYIEAIKSGNMNLTPETFPRMPGTEITAEFFEKTSSFSEPIVIPRSFNPRPGRIGRSTQQRSQSDDSMELVPDEGQDDIDMVIPQELTVRRVSELFGPKNLIPVIDVKAQESSKGWTVEKWADYYESVGDKPIRNVISLECSNTPLGRLIRRPKVVRDLDLQDSVWPDAEWRKSVGFYVLMSVADCFTDFHIDFGGSSVYYHILKGRKVFFFIPPTPSNLQKYQDWNDMPSQNWTWLPDQTKTKECYRVDLYPGDTMLIPAGWIHAVWTPEDSLVIGGNFLTRLHYAMQFRVTEIEKANKTPIAFRYPKFQKVMWYTILLYLEQDPLPVTVRDIFLDGNRFERDRPIWSEFDKFGENSDPGPENYNTRYYPKAEVDGLPDMVNYIFRTVMIYMDRLENITKETRKAVADSIPKGKGEPLDIAQDFAMWVAWKRGNEDVPEWAHPGAVLPNKPEEPVEKKLSDAQFKKLQKTSAIYAPERQSARLKSVAEAAAQYEQSLSSTPKTSTLGPRRTACDSCRKRKMRCKHVESGNNTSSSPAAFPPSLETSPRSGLFGVVIPVAPQPIAAYQPPPKVETPAPIPPSLETVMEPFTPNSKHDVDSKKGRTKACYDCRRSKRRCIHDEHGRVDPVKQKEPVVPRGSAKRKQGPSPELPLAKKPNTGNGDHIAPTAPMFAIPATSETWANGVKDGMFRNSTVNDFSGGAGVANVNPLAGMGQDSESWFEDLMESRAEREDLQMDVGVKDEAENQFFNYDDSVPEPEPMSIEERVLTLANDYGHEPVSQAQQALDFPIDPKLGAAVHGTSRNEQIDPALAETSEPNTDFIAVDPQLQDYANTQFRTTDQPEALTNGIEDDARQPLPATMEVEPRTQSVEPNTQNGKTQAEKSNGSVLPTTEETLSTIKRLSSREAKPVDRFVPEPTGDGSPVKQGRNSIQTPRASIVNGKSTSPEVGRSSKAKATIAKTVEADGLVKNENESAIEETDEETRRLIEQLRQENLQTKGLRRRS